MQYIFSFALQEKQKYRVSNVHVKSKIVTFASKRIIEFKQFLKRPNLACSVAKTDRRFFFGFDVPRNHFKLRSISKPI